MSCIRCKSQGFISGTKVKATAKQFILFGQLGLFSTPVAGLSLFGPHASQKVPNPKPYPYLLNTKMFCLDGYLAGYTTILPVIYRTIEDEYWPFQAPALRPRLTRTLNPLNPKPSNPKAPKLSSTPKHWLDLEFHRKSEPQSFVTKSFAHRFLICVRLRHLQEGTIHKPFPFASPAAHQHNCRRLTCSQATFAYMHNYFQRR